MKILLVFFCTLFQFVSMSCFSQIPIWLQKIGNGNTVQVLGMTHDSKGNVYCTGYFQGVFSSNIGSYNSNGSNDIFITKTSANGKLLWIKTYGGNLDDGGVSICVDENDNPLLTGFSGGNMVVGFDTIQGNGFVLKLSSSGILLWVKDLISNSANGKDIISFDNRIFVLGEFSNSLILGPDTIINYGWIDIFIAELDSSGNVLSGCGIGSSDREYAYSISKCGSDNIVVAGGNEYVGIGISYGVDLATSGGHFIARYNFVTKHWLTAKIIASASYGEIYCKCDDNKNIYSAGGYKYAGVFDTISLPGNTIFNDLFVAKFDSSLNVFWAKKAQSSTDIYTTGIEMDQRNTLFLYGSFGQQTIFGNDTLTNQGVNGIDDLFIAKCNDQGQFISANRYGGSNNEVPHGFEINSSGAIFVVGLFYQDISMGSFNAYSTSISGDIYVAKLIDITDSAHKRIEGKIIWDRNSNCSIDSLDAITPVTLTRAMPGPFYGLSNSDGEYQIYTDSSDYLVEQLGIGNAWIQTCIPSYNVILSGSDTVIRNIDFYNNNSTFNCAVPWVDIVPNSTLRRCDPTTYIVTYCNKGGFDLPNAYIDVMIDSGLSMISSTISSTYIDNGYYRFNVGTISPGECNSFNILIRVDCTIPLATIKCVKAKILPDVSCGATDTSYYQRQLLLTGGCNSFDSVYFKIKNTNSVNYMQILYYKIFVNDSLAISRQQSLLPGDSLVINYPSFGNTIRIVVGYLFNGKDVYQLTLNECGAPSSYNSTNLSELDQDLNQESTCNPVVGSYDPNLKIVRPTGILSQHYVSPSEELEYTIYFQNTGTDTAFTVVIYDTLSIFLDLSKLQIMSASHLFNIGIFNGNVLRWTFNNILLPDSNIDEVHSHGFVKFKIHPLDSVPDFSIVNNSAAIVFDYNDPVITNRVDVTLHDTTLTCHLPIAIFTSLVNDTLVQFNNLSLNSIYSIWNFGDGQSDTSSSTQHYYSVGVYQICLSAINGCGIDTSCDILNININSIKSLASELINLYPNPTTEKITLNTEKTNGGFDNLTLGISNVFGSIVYLKKIEQSKTELDLKKILDSGLYLIYLLDENGKIVYSKKILLQDM